MTPWLQIIIPVEKPGPELAATVDSLKAQTDRDFGVMLCDNCSLPELLDPADRLDHFRQARADLTAAGISEVVNRGPRFKLSRIEYWNWAHAQAEADWLKPLLPGVRLDPAYVAKLRERIAQRPAAQFIRCDAHIETEWGVETLPAPFTQASLTAREFLNYFPSRVDWIGHLINVAYRRIAWRSLGGFSVHLPACAALNLNALLALHHGLENLPECLVTGDLPEKLSLNEIDSGRVNLSLELWLVMRQVRNYCLAAKLPWPQRGVTRGIWRAANSPTGAWFLPRTK